MTSHVHGRDQFTNAHPFKSEASKWSDHDKRFSLTGGLELQYPEWDLAKNNYDFH